MMNGRLTLSTFIELLNNILKMEPKITVKFEVFGVSIKLSRVGSKRILILFNDDFLLSRSQL